MGPYASLRNDLRSVPALALVAAISILTGCGGGGSSTPAAPVAVTVAGNNQVRLGTTAQFTAAVTNTSNSAVNWQVNGVTGGAAATGTISTTGLYTPPAAIPAPNTVTITAVSQASPSSSGSMSEAILNPIPTITAATVAGLGPSYTITVTGAGFVTGAQVQLQGQTIAATVTSPTQLTCTANLTLAQGTNTIPVSVINPDPGTATSSPANAQVTIQAPVTTAARLLDQTTFGPTLTDIQHVESVGIAGYLSEQFAAQPTTLALIAATPPTACTNNLVPCAAIRVVAGHPHRARSTPPARRLRARRDVRHLHQLRQLPRRRRLPEHPRQRRLRQLRHHHEGRHPLPRHGRLSQHAQQQQAHHRERCSPDR